MSHALNHAKASPGELGGLLIAVASSKQGGDVKVTDKLIRRHARWPMLLVFAVLGAFLLLGAAGVLAQKADIDRPIALVGGMLLDGARAFRKQRGKHCQ